MSVTVTPEIVTLELNVPPEVWTFAAIAPVMLVFASEISSILSPAANDPPNVSASVPLGASLAQHASNTHCVLGDIDGET